MKLKFSPEQIYSNPQKAFNKFANKITQGTKNKIQISPKEVSTEIYRYNNIFAKKNMTSLFTNLAMQLAQTLVSLGDNNLAGTIYSFLIKTNGGNAKLAEQIATNALAIAKRQHDPIHIMARANDLNNIFKVTAPQSKRRLTILYDEKRALNDICTNYEKVSKRYKTLTRRMKPVEVYEIMLASIKIQIAEFVASTDKYLAKEEALGAKKILDKYGKGKLTQQVNRLLTNLEK